MDFDNTHFTKKPYRFTSSSKEIKEDFSEILGVDAIDTYAKILEYQDAKPSFLDAPEDRFFDLSIITTKLSVLNSERIMYLSSRDWKAVVAENSYSESGGYACDYYHIDSDLGLTIYFINRSEDRKFSLIQIREFLNHIEITSANNKGSCRLSLRKSD